MAPGFRWEFVEAWELGASVRIPLSGPEADEEDFRAVFGFLWHFPLPR
ncbi:MAG: hypothetical protein OER90_19915 [Gemmatimonadota bacterium]|nr:hypothetical protein [Gemmatimonadota bacterium]